MEVWRCVEVWGVWRCGVCGGVWCVEAGVSSYFVTDGIECIIIHMLHVFIMTT